MRAIVFEEFGEPGEVLKWGERPEPAPDSGQVLVRMLASPINPSDLMVVRGKYGQLPKLPATPGFEGVGIVEKSGGGLLGRFMVGKRVAVLNSLTGNWAQKTVALAKQVIPIPKSVPLEQAAMFFVNPATSFILTRRVLCVPSGGWLLQTAAGSALGKMVIRLGRHFGFKTLNIVRRSEQVAELKAAGGDAVVAFDPTSSPSPNEIDNFKRQVLEATAGQGVQLAIDAVGGATATAVASVLGDNGRLVLYGTLSTAKMELEPRNLIVRRLRLEGFWLGHWMAQQSLLGKISLIRTVSGLIQSGTLSSQVAGTYSPDQIATAVAHAERPAKTGKVLLRFGE